MASPPAMLATFLAYVAAVSAVQASPELALLQHRANVKAKASHTESGAVDVIVADKVPLTEKGYQQVALQKSNAEMKVFINRLLAKEARYVKDAAGLEGFVGFYSGKEGVQNLETLKAELRNAHWVAIGEGRTAPLNELGYQKVAKLKSNSDMTAFIRRLLDLSGKKCIDEGALTGLVPYYSGQMATQTFEQLTREVLSSAWVATRGEEINHDAVGKDVDQKGRIGSVIIPNKKELDKEDDLRVVFEGFDLDGNGRLSTAELGKALQNFDREFTAEAVEEMLVEADSDGNGEIGLEEFEEKMKA